jgi:O-antigen/teichoic acid export membrane protein
LIALFTVPILTRILTPEEYGVTLLINTSLALLTFALNLGLDQAFTALFCQSEDMRERRMISSTILVSRLVMFGMAVISVLLVPAYINSLLFPSYNGILVIVLAVVGFFVTTLISHFSLILRFLERHKLRFRLELALLLGQTVLSLTLIIGFGWRIEGIYAGTLIVGLAVLPVFYAFSRGYVQLIFSKNIFGELLKYGLPLVPAGAAFFIVGQTPSYFIKHYVSLDEVGIYSVAASLASVLLIVVTGFQQVWSPYVHSYYKEPETRQSFVRLYCIFSSVLFMVAVFLCLFAQEIVDVLIGPKFHLAYLYVPAIVLSHSCSTLGRNFSIGIGLTRKTYHRAWPSVIGAALYLILAFSLTPRFGLWGIIASQIVAFVMVGILLHTISQRLIRISYPYARNIAMWVLGVAFVSISYGLEPGWPAILEKLFIGILCLGLPFTLRILSTKDLVASAQLIRGWSTNL